VKYLFVLLLLSSCNNVNTPYIDNITLLKIEKNFNMIERLKDLIANNFIAKKIQEKNNIFIEKP
jgi:hypothetical protein